MSHGREEIAENSIVSIPEKKYSLGFAHSRRVRSSHSMKSI